MSSSPSQHGSDFPSQVLDTALGTYLVLEVYRDAELSLPQSAPNHSAPRPRLWSVAAVTVLGLLLALLAIETAPRAIATFSRQAQATVADLGVPTRWRF